MIKNLCFLVSLFLLIFANSFLFILPSIDKNKKIEIKVPYVNQQTLNVLTNRIDLTKILFYDMQKSYALYYFNNTNKFYYEDIYFFEQFSALMGQEYINIKTNLLLNTKFRVFYDESREVLRYVDIRNSIFDFSNRTILVCIKEQVEPKNKFSFKDYFYKIDF